MTSGSLGGDLSLSFRRTKNHPQITLGCTLEVAGKSLLLSYHALQIQGPEVLELELT